MSKKTSKKQTTIVNILTGEETPVEADSIRFQFPNGEWLEAKQQDNGTLIIYAKSTIKVMPRAANSIEIESEPQHERMAREEKRLGES